MDDSERLEAALSGMQSGWSNGHHGPAHELLLLWGEKLGARPSRLEWDPSSVRFEMDTSQILLRGMGLVPAVLLGGGGDAVNAALLRFQAQDWDDRQQCLVICATDEAYSLAGHTLRGRKGLVLSLADIRTTLLDSDPKTRLRMQILRQMSFRSLIPFTVTHPVEGGMFFGRTEELKLLSEEGHVGYAICGPGSVGKTSLINQALWQLRCDLDPRYHRIVTVDLLDCKRDSNFVAGYIAQQVSHTSFADVLGVDDLEAFFKRMRYGDARFRRGPIELFLDETDEALAYDRSQGYRLLKALRHAANRDMISVCFAGRTEPLSVMRDPQCPFHERAKVLKLGALRPDEAKELLLRPLEHLDVVIENQPQLLRTVMSDTVGYPRAIQRWGLAVANQVASRARRRFTDSDLLEVRATLSVGVESKEA